MNAQLHVRVNVENPDHHLWLNNGTWFVHYTVHRADFTKARVRTSLKTRSIIRARRLRDRLLRQGSVSDNIGIAFSPVTEENGQ